MKTYRIFFKGPGVPFQSDPSTVHQSYGPILTLWVESNACSLPVNVQSITIFPVGHNIFQGHSSPVAFNNRYNEEYIAGEIRLSAMDMELALEFAMQMPWVRDNKISAEVVEEKRLYRVKKPTVIQQPLLPNHN